MADELEATVNYSEVQAAAERCLQDGAFTLIETAAQATARRVAQTFVVDDVEVKVAKPAASRSAPTACPRRIGWMNDFRIRH